MKTIFKLFIWLIAMVFVLVIAVGVAVFTLDPNQHKDWIIAQVEESSGRSLALDGDINLTLYPWLGLEARDITLGNASGFGNEAFLHTDYIHLRVKFMPLLQEQYEVDTVQVHGAVVNLAINRDGVSNWADLAGDGTESGGGFPLAAIILGGVDIQNASLSWNDQTTDTQYKISNFNMSTGELVYGQPIDIELSLDAASNKPTIRGNATLTGTIAYDLDNEQVRIEPLKMTSHIESKNIPGGKTDTVISTRVHLDLDKDTLVVSDLAVDALDTIVSGNIDVSKVSSPYPSISANLDVNGADLSHWFKLMEIEPLASQLAGLSDRRFNLQTKVSANMARGDVDVSQFNANLLGADIKGEIKARNIQSESPSYLGALKATGPDLPTLLQVVGQFEGGETSQLATYGKKLSSIAKSQKAFSTDIQFDADMKSGDISIPGLSMRGLGLTVRGNLVAKGMDSQAGSIDGHFVVTGQNLKRVLTALDQESIAEVLHNIRIETGISGNRSNIKLRPLALNAIFSGKQIPNSPVRLEVSADSNINLDKERLTLNSFSVKGLGLNVSGKLIASDIQSESPSYQGTLKATGPDLPFLLQVVGQFQGGNESQLANYGKKLSLIAKSQKAFSTDIQFDADMKSGDISIPGLSMRGLGLTVNGNLVATDMNSQTGSVDGRFVVTGQNLKRVLEALDQESIAEVLQNIRIEAGISGNRSNINLRPLALNAIFSGKQIPNSPVRLEVSADSNINLDKERLTLDSFSVKGMGLNISGMLNANDVLQTPQFNGQINVAQFNLRQLMGQLNMEVPKTADRRVLQKVSLNTAFDGSAKNINISDMKLVMDETTLQGTLSVTDFENPATTFNINIDKINADRYLQPVQEGDGKRPVTPEAAVGAAVQLPIEMLRSLNTNGTLEVNEFIISNLRFTDMKFTLNAKDGDIKLAPALAKMYQGSYKGNIKLNATGKIPRVTINSSLKGVQIEPLLLDLMDKADLVGKSDISLAMFMVGDNTDTMKQTMSGQGEVKLSNGELRGIDVKGLLDQLEIMIESKNIGNKVDKGEVTKFDSFDLVFNMNQGVAVSEKFLMTAPGFKVTGKGVLANLNNNTIKYNLDVAVDETSATREEERYNLGGYSIPVKCRGQLDAPDCKPEYFSIVKTILQKGIMDKLLKNTLGNGPGNTGEGETSGQAQDPTKELFNKALKGLFDR